MNKLLLTACTCLLLSGNAAALELQSVLERSMVTPPARVNFREERHNELFAEPLRLAGFLEYLENGELRKVIKEPFEESFHVRGDRVEIERAGEVQTLPINKSRALKIMLGSIEAILLGEADRIEKLFTYELSGSESDWTLQLAPRSRRMARQMPGLRFTGDGESITSIHIELSGGEWHRMELLPEAASQ